MSTAEKLWWCKCIEQNRFRFNFGRQANRTLSSLSVPAEVPPSIKALAVPELAKAAAGTALKLPVKDWPMVPLTDLFDMIPGKQSVRRNMKKGTVPWVSSSAENNGITAYVDVKPEFPAGCLTVANNGSIGASFYQPDPFTASADVTVLKPKFDMGVLCGLFVCSVLRHEAFRYNYARKWTPARMQATKLPVPLDAQGNPDRAAVEVVVKRSPYSALVAVGSN